MSKKRKEIARLNQEDAEGNSEKLKKTIEDLEKQQEEVQQNVVRFRQRDFFLETIRDFFKQEALKDSFIQIVKMVDIISHAGSDLQDLAMPLVNFVFLCFLPEMIEEVNIPLLEREKFIETRRKELAKKTMTEREKEESIYVQIEPVSKKGGKTEESS
jgi:hypothetical protein